MSFKKILRILMIVSLPLLLTACSNSSGIWSNDVAGNAASANSDISIGFLGQIFGNVGSVIQGNNNQLLGQLFYQFNMGILMVIGVFLIYTVLTSALRGANEGSFVGQGKNVAYNCLKVGLGVAMILPNASTGYCLVQELMMDVTVSGVHLADNIWNTALNYLDSGHSVWSDPNDSGNQAQSYINKDSFNAFMGNPDGNGGGTPDMVHALGFQVMQMAYCMIDSNAGKSMSPSVNFGGDGSTKNLYFSRYEFPSATDDAGCGSIDWSQINQISKYTYNSGIGSLCNADNPDASGDSSEYCQIAQGAVSAVINSVMPAAKAQYCSGDPQNANCSAYKADDLKTDIANDLYMADINYTNDIYAAYDKIENSKGGDFSKAQKDGETDGWMMAGRYYWDMAQKSQNTSNADISTYFLNYGAFSNNPGDSGGIITKNTMSSYWSDAQTQVIDYANALDTANGTSTDTSETNWSNTSNDPAWYDYLGEYLMPGIAKIFEQFNAAGATANPIEWISHLGLDCIQEAGGMWVSAMTGFSLLMMFAAIMSCTNPAGYAVSEVAAWVRPIMFAIIGMLMSVGVILGFYMPLYPFMVFTFSIIAWLVAVIEAMAAAPLVAFGLTHPEGHDFLGKAEQAIMLALSVFLRPALMILGLISGMILSFVAFKIINYSYCSFMQDLYTSTIAGNAGNSGNILSSAGTGMGNVISYTSSPFVCLFSLPALLVIYSAIVMEVTHQCYSLIYQLPDYIMRWVGAPNTSSPVQIEKLAGGVKGATSGLGSGFSKGMEGSASEKGRQHQKTAQENEREQKRKNAKKATVTSRGPAAS